MGTRRRFWTAAAAVATVFGCGGRTDGVGEAPAPAGSTPLPHADAGSPAADAGSAAAEAGAPEAPEALWTGGSPQGLAIDSGWLYWADSAEGTIQKMRTDGTAHTVLASQQAGPSGVSVSAGVVCWTNAGGGEVRVMPIDGGPIVTLADGQSSPRAVTIAGQAVFFTTATDLMELPLGGGTPVSRLATDGQGGAQGVASVAAAGGYIAVAPQAAVFPADSAADASAVVLQPFKPYAKPSVRGMAWFDDGTQVSVFYAGAEGVFSAGVAPSGSPANLAMDAAGPEAIAVDAQNVFWVDAGTAPDYGDGALVRLRRADGSRALLAQQQEHPMAIVQDDASVYWTDAGTAHPGAVMRIAK
jgi:hypothetical protein